MLCLLAGCAATGQPSPEAYGSYAARLQARGLLRTDTAPPDAPFDNALLARNFALIALREERRPPEPSVPAALQRWAGPVRWHLGGGGATAADRAEVEALFGRIAALTRLAITEDPATPNFVVLITTPAERAGYAEAFAGSSPALARSFDYWRSSGEAVCLVTIAFDRARHEIEAAFVFIGSEVSGVLRRSCLHEEIVQGFGLGNDDATVRPSMFNDDEEFALLTDHDAWLLRLLYHPALRPGMTESEAMPVVRRILATLRPEPGA